MTPNMERGARIIIHEWVKVRAWDKVLIVTSKEYLAEAKAMEKEASGKARSVNTLLVENKGRHVGIFFDDNEAVFDPYTAIIAATEYSLVTTKAAKRAIQRHKKFLSQFVFLRKYTVIGKYFQICNFYLIIILTCFFIYIFHNYYSSHLSLFLPVCFPVCKTS